MGTGTEDVRYRQVHHSLLPRGQYPLNTHRELPLPLTGHMGLCPTLTHAHNLPHSLPLLQVPPHRQQELEPGAEGWEGAPQPLTHLVVLTFQQTKEKTQSTAHILSA